MHKRYIIWHKTSDGWSICEETNDEAALSTLLRQAIDISYGAEVLVTENLPYAFIIQKPANRPGTN